MVPFKYDTKSKWSNFRLSIRLTSMPTNRCWPVDHLPQPALFGLVFCCPHRSTRCSPTDSRIQLRGKLINVQLIPSHQQVALQSSPLGPSVHPPVWGPRRSKYHNSGINCFRRANYQSVSTYPSGPVWPGTPLLKYIFINFSEFFKSWVGFCNSRIELPWGQQQQ